ncbi:MAG: hypothetical protein KJO21_03825 [Verrucomicrobiae bacterium]|nr:hypothetical protein [Verrucomicrobiae bacterium]NNJ42628.1 hypothetical protein [Akkermansiaceae bacterium]
MQAHDNPFATDRVERLLTFNPAWADTSWPSIETRWQKLGRRATLTGRHGSGKTTFLDAWKKRLHQDGHESLDLFLNRENSTLDPKSWQALAHCIGKTIILDGEEQLSWIARRKFYALTRDAHALLVTRHRASKLPCLLHLDPAISLLDRCVQALAPDHYDALRTHFPSWWHQTRGNIRESLLLCYDAVGDMHP